MPYKQHPKSTKIVPYSNDTVYSPFVPYGETKTIAPDLTTIDDNRIAHIPNQDAPIGEDVALVPIPSNRRWLVVCHAIESLPGLSAVVAIVCAEKGRKNTSGITATPTMPSGFERFTINEKPLTTDFIKNPNLNNFEDVIPFSEYEQLSQTTLGENGEYEYDPGITVNVFVNYAPNAAFLVYASNTMSPTQTIETIYVGQGQAGRTEAYNNCLSTGSKSAKFKMAVAYNASATAKYKTRNVYLLKVTVIEDIIGVLTYEGQCRAPKPGEDPNTPNPGGIPVHECFLHDPVIDVPDENNTPPENSSNTDDPNNPPPNKRIYTYAAIDPPSYSLYNLFMNFQGKIEYFGSVWVLDPNLPTCVVSKTYSGDVDLKFTYAYEIDDNNEIVYKEYYTKYRASKTKATSNFSNSGAEMLTISPETASQTLTWQADTIQLLQNVDSSMSQYYGLGELGYIAIVIGAASVL